MQGLVTWFFQSLYFVYSFPVDTVKSPLGNGSVFTDFWSTIRLLIRSFIDSAILTFG